MALGAALCVALLAGCAQAAFTPGPPGDGNAGSGKGGAGMGALAGRSFVSGAVTRNGKDSPLVPGSELTLAFDGKGFSAHAGCNSMSAAARLRDGRLVLDDDGMAVTEMACDAPLMDQDEWFAAFMTAGPRVSLSGDTLVLAAGDAVIRFTDRRIARPDAPLRGTTWVLDGVIDGDTASSVPVGVTSTLRIDGDRLFLETGCNGGGADVSVGDDRLRVGALVLTRAACSDARGSVEAAVLEVLRGEVRYRIDGSLTISRGTVGLTYRATAENPS